jgi:hypothetical protein
MHDASTLSPEERFAEEIHAALYRYRMTRGGPHQRESFTDALVWMQDVGETRAQLVRHVARSTRRALLLAARGTRRAA